MFNPQEDNVLSVSTMNCCLNILRSYFNCAESEQYI